MIADTHTAATDSLAAPALARNILVAFDGSRGARDALAYGAAIARATHGRLTVMTVVPPPPLPAPGMIGAFDPRSIERGMVAQLRSAAETVPEDVPVTTIVAHGHAAGEIVRRAEQGCHDLVVLGCEGHGPLKGAMAGVCPRVLRHSRVPVLVIHPPPED